MARYLVIRDGAGVENVVAEAELLAEQSLHDVLTRHPELIPADDLEIGTPVVVGRESGLEAGYADLVLLDGDAQLCLVEVKKEGNPDTRRVVAQLLDYAAALWQMTAEAFQASVLHPYLRSTGVPPEDVPDLGSFAAHQFGSAGGMSDDPGFDDFGSRLEQSLASGRFRLVVAAPSIPPGVQQVIEYLNAQGLFIYGLEVSFFSGPAECFVPRLVVKPRVTETRKLVASASTPITREGFVEALPDRIRDPAVAFLSAAEADRATVRWNVYGPAIRPARTPERVISWLEKKRIVITVKAFAGYPVEPFEAARKATGELSVGSVSSDDWYWSARYEELTDDQLTAAFGIALNLVAAVTEPITFQGLKTPIAVSFQRNDHNVWAKAVDQLGDQRGCWLRGTLQASSGPLAAAVTLEPLGGGAPGWKPRFESADVGSLIWPFGELHGDYQLTITEVGSSAG
ncbi:MAG TPA: hypothetical protein VGG41_11910 [Solirubrobacteraceae bacterium]|jgi:hypothetical protein